LLSDSLPIKTALHNNTIVITKLLGDSQSNWATKKAPR